MIFQNWNLIFQKSQQEPWKAKQRPCKALFYKGIFGVADGTRTHDDRNHNPEPIHKIINSLRKFFGI